MKYGSLGLYVHVPFCNSICNYCDFYSGKYNEQTQDNYVSAIVNAFNNQPFGNRTVESIFFGGGTPSSIGHDRLSDILKAIKRNFNTNCDCEITLEANPESSSLQFLEKVYEAGFNRISFGVQSFDEKELQMLGRIHDGEQAEQGIINAHKVGFQSISADLMLGIPYQTSGNIKANLDRLISLPLNHISAYMLIVEPGTPFAKMDLDGLIMSDGELAESYLFTVSYLEKAGFSQYEISNFAKKGGESRHNLKYWMLEEYLGVGPSAHSFIDGKRFEFSANINNFINSKGSWDQIMNAEHGGDSTEYAMLRLRLRDGLNLEEYKKIYPDVDIDYMLKTALELEKLEYMNISGKVISFTPKGFLISNSLISQLI